MPATRVSSSRGAIKLTIDGLTFVRTRKAHGDPPGTSPRETVEWARIAGATLEHSRNGRPVVRVQVTDLLPVEHHRDDSYALKLRRKDADAAARFVAAVNEETQLRGRWDSSA